MQLETNLHQMKLEKQELKVSEQKLRMRAQFLEKELKNTNEGLIQEKVKIQEFQNEVNETKFTKEY